MVCVARVAQGRWKGAMTKEQAVSVLGISLKKVLQEHCTFTAQGSHLY